MLRKVIVLTLLLIYVGTTGGFALTLHFCGTKVSNVRINHSDSKPCCKDEAEAPDKCCKDKQISIKLSDEQQASKSLNLPPVTEFTSGYSIVDLGEQIPLISTLGRVSHSSGGFYSIPIIIKNCVFRI